MAKQTKSKGKVNEQRCEGVIQGLLVLDAEVGVLQLCHYEPTGTDWSERQRKQRENITFIMLNSPLRHN